MTDPDTIQKDGLWSWLVVVACFMVRVFVYGMTTTSGILYVIFLDEFKESKGSTAIIASLITAAGYFIGAVGGILVNKFGCRTVVILAGIIAGSGLIVSAFARSVIHLIITYGIVAGCGFGLCYVPCSVLVAQYFEKKRNLALGLASSGGGLGGFLFPILLRWLIGLYGWRGTLVIAGGLTFNICVCGSIMRPFVDANPKSMTASQADVASSLFHWSIFKNVRYLILLVNSLLFAFSISVIYVHLSAFGKSIGITEDQSAHVFSAMGIGLALSKVGTGLLATHPKVDEHVVYIGFLCLGGVCAAVLPALKSIYWFGTMACIFSLVFATQGGCLIPSLCVRYCGMERLSTAYGMSLVISGVGHFLGGPVAGWLFECTGVYANSFYLSGATTLVAAFMMFIPWKLLEPVTEMTLNDTYVEDGLPEKVALKDPVRDRLIAPKALPELSLEEIPMI